MFIIGPAHTVFSLLICILAMQKDHKKKRADKRLEERRIYERAIRAVIAREGNIEEVSWNPSLRINRTTELTSTDLFSAHKDGKKKIVKHPNSSQITKISGFGRSSDYKS